MDLDERIEALVQSVELLSAMHKDQEERAKQSERVLNQLAGRNARLEELTEQIAEGTVACFMQSRPTNNASAI